MIVSQIPGCTISPLPPWYERCGQLAMADCLSRDTNLQEHSI